MKNPNVVNTGLLVVILVLIIYIIFAALNPLNAWAVSRERNIVTQAAKASGVSVGEFQYMAEVGKTTGFEDIEKLKKLSKYNSDVYANAKNGDRAIAFGAKMVLYRPSTGAVVYKGDSPGQKQLADQQTQLNTIVQKIKDAGIVTKDSKEVPQIATINNIEQLKNNQFYTGAQNGDLILIFNNEGVVVIYNEKDGKIINAGRSTLVPLGATTEKK